MIIGNPPYNVGQKSENDNNQNRKYKEIDQRIRDTYAKDSQATNKNGIMGSRPERPNSFSAVRAK